VKDGFYQFLKLKHDWEQSVLNKKKDITEQQEALPSSLQTSVIVQTIRNRQSLAHSNGECDCTMKDETQKNRKHIRIIKKLDKAYTGKTTTDGEHLFATAIGFYDETNVYHQYPETLYCVEHEMPRLSYNGKTYKINIGNYHQQHRHSLTLQYNSSSADWQRHELAAFDETNLYIEIKEGNFIVFEDEDQAPPLAAFVPIWCVGDDASHAITKPTVYYEEIEGSKIVIANMPAYQTQDDLSDCTTFALGVILQKHNCDEWTKDIPDCENPPNDLAISYFGLSIYTHNNTKEKKSYAINSERPRNMYDVLLEISRINLFILESCKQFYKLVESFSLNGQAGFDKRDRFFEYLNKLYKQKNAQEEDDVTDCSECLDEIVKLTGMNVESFNMKKALSKDSFDKFLYSLFFDNCELFPFADGYKPNAYPRDNADVSPNEVKNKVIEILKKNKPVYLTNLCIEKISTNECNSLHALVVSGYKKVYQSSNPNKRKELFKLHNSWGEDWQKQNNNGWVDADILVNHIDLQDGRIPSQTLVWIDTD
jgi:hypothetical protein